MECLVEPSAEVALWARLSEIQDRMASILVILAAHQVVLTTTKDKLSNEHKRLEALIEYQWAVITCRKAVIVTLRGMVSQIVGRSAEERKGHLQELGVVLEEQAKSVGELEGLHAEINMCATEMKRLVEICEEGRAPLLFEWEELQKEREALDMEWGQAKA